MADEILLRDVPKQVQDWLKAAKAETNTNQSKIILTLVRQSIEKGSLQLFPAPPKLNVADGDIRLPFKFIDLFAGIGGFRIGLQRAGGQCSFTCEWDKYAQKTYKAWFGDEHIAGDVSDVTNELASNPDIIPDHDVLAAGFPCQPFSIAGVSKKKSLGREHGFEDKTQGTLFFHIAKIIDAKRPPVIILENVKNLLSHNKGSTWQTIHSVLDKELNYQVFVDVLDAAVFVPQHRERVFIVGFDREEFGEHIPFEFPDLSGGTRPKFKSILEKRVPEKYVLSDKLWRYLRDYAQNHKAKGNGFGYGIADPEGVSRTLSARYYKDGSEVLISRGPSRNPQRLTPTEAARLMGFEEYADKIVVSDTQAYKQFGNAVVPAIVHSVAKQLVKVMAWHIGRRANGCLIKRVGHGK